MSHPEQPLVVSGTGGQADPTASATTFLLRVSARLDVREPVLMSYLVYFTQLSRAQRMRSAAGQAGWRATLSAVPEAYVVRLTRLHRITSGRIEAEREQILRLSTTYGGDWRYVSVEQQGHTGTWEQLAQQIAEQAEQSTAGASAPSETGTSETSGTWARSAAG